MTAGQKETLTKGLIQQHAGYDHTFYKTQKSACKRQTHAGTEYPWVVKNIPNWNQKHWWTTERKTHNPANNHASLWSKQAWSFQLNWSVFNMEECVSQIEVILFSSPDAHWIMHPPKGWNPLISINRVLLFIDAKWCFFFCLHPTLLFNINIFKFSCQDSCLLIWGWRQNCT